MLSKSMVENYFAQANQIPTILDEKIPILTLKDFSQLGQLLALRFLEQVIEKPDSVVALPTGKGADSFVKWLHYYIREWDSPKNQELFTQIGLKLEQPQFSELMLVQQGEYFPIAPDDTRSLHYFVRKNYLEPLGIPEERALLWDAWDLKNSADLREYVHLGNILNHHNFSLSDVNNQPDQNTKRKIQIIQYFNKVSEERETKIRSLGGLDFVLAEAGAKGQVIFNVAGSTQYSTTRLCEMNWAAKAKAAHDLGGILEVEGRGVFTLGIETLKYNSNANLVFFSMGEDNSSYVRNAATESASVENPLSAFQSHQNSRLFLTHGAGIKLKKRRLTNLELNYNWQELEKLFIEECSSLNIAIKESKGYTENPIFAKLSELSGESLESLSQKVENLFKDRIKSGLSVPDGKVFLHTAPHHDDIELAYFPYIHHLARTKSNSHFFSYMTPGFNAVTDHYLAEVLKNLLRLIEADIIKLDKVAHQEGWDRQDEINKYLNAVAEMDERKQLIAFSNMIFRRLSAELSESIDTIKNILGELLDGLATDTFGKNVRSELKNKIKTWIREWEAELVWAHFGMPANNVSHQKLGFYGGHDSDAVDAADANKILELLESIKPDIVTVAMDPEGSGPDSHFRTLVAVGNGVRKYVEKTGKKDIQVWGYRNVWSRFHFSEVNTIVPVSLNAYAVVHQMFNTCFGSQKNAEFPSPIHEGTFSDVAQVIWSYQFKKLKELLGENYFYRSDKAMLRRAFGALMLHKMPWQEFDERLDYWLELVSERRNISRQS